MLKLFGRKNKSPEFIFGDFNRLVEPIEIRFENENDLQRTLHDELNAYLKKQGFHISDEEFLKDIDAILDHVGMKGSKKTKGNNERDVGVVNSKRSDVQSVIGKIDVPTDSPVIIEKRGISTVRHFRGNPGRKKYGYDWRRRKNHNIVSDEVSMKFRNLGPNRLNRRRTPPIPTSIKIPHLQSKSQRKRGRSTRARRSRSMD